MDLNSPILVRLFKQEAELEVWKQDRSGRFALLKTYPICRWSGDLGPKVREGDRQAPEGFYTISPAQMNPQSAYYLSFNTGYPNAFDKALGRTGSQLMVHGDCSSRGCYAMTDEQIAEIYSLGRESFFGGQRAFQLQAYPFKMTPVNMAKHRNNPNMPFWKMIKEGYDHFEVTRQEPKVDFCEKKYVFDAIKRAERHARSGIRRFGQMPGLRDSGGNRRRRAREAAEDQAETAKLIAKGTPVARMNTGIDGGMNKVFAAKLPDGNTGLSEGGDGQGLSLLALSRAPGTIPSHVNPPRGPRLPRICCSARQSSQARRPRRTGRPRRRRGSPPRRRARRIRRLLLQPRPQGRLRRLGRDHRERAAARQAEGDRGQANRAPPRHEAAEPKAPRRSAEHQAGRRNRPPLKPSVSDTPPAPPAPAKDSGGRLSADRPVELVREPLRGDEVIHRRRTGERRDP